MDKIKSKIHKDNKHFVLGLSFVVFSLIASIYWGLTYAEDTTLTPVAGVNTTTTYIPQAPTNLTAVVDGNKVTLNWTDNSDNEAGFKIYRGPIWTDIGNVGPNVTTFTDQGRAAGTYTYRLNAFNGSYAYSPISNDVTVTVVGTTSVTNTTTGDTNPPPTSTTTTTTETPTSPTNFKQVVATTASTISLSWTNGTILQDMIKIQKRISGTTAWLSLISLPGTANSYSDYSAPVGSIYDYQIQSCMGSICSPFALLEKIYSATAYGGGTNGTTCTGISLTLNDNKTSYNVGDTVNYTWVCNPVSSTGNVSIWLGKPDGTISSLNYGTNSNTQTLGLNTSNLIPGSYVLKACLGTSCTATGTMMSTQTFNVTAVAQNITTPTAPTNLRKIVSTLSNAISLAWTNSSTSQDQINIEKKLSTATEWFVLTKLTSSTISYFVDRLVTAGIFYDYRIKSCLAGVCSSYITLEKVTPDNTTISNTLNTTNTSGATNNTIESVKPQAPTNLTAVVDGNKVTLNWTDNSDNEAGFKIYRGPIWTDIGNVGPNVTTFTDQGRAAGTYTYRLNAFNGSYAYSPISNDVTVTVVGTTSATNTTTPVVAPVTIPKITTPITTTTPTPVLTTPTTTKIQVDNVNINTVNPTYPPVVATTTLPAINPAIVIPDNKDTSQLETPTDIINSVTAALNIIPKLPEVNTDVAQPKIINKEDVAKTQEEIKKEEVAQQEVAKLVYQDTNKDGISDYDSKYIYNIDPVKPSPVSTYEGRSVTAGEKILLGFDPAKTELAKVVTVEDPTVPKPEKVVTSYKVNEIKLTENKKIVLKGQALPNSYITLYIYSTPIMVTVKTDSNGEWQYQLDKELENGNHTVYTATVNNTGNIVAKSTPYSFVKTAEAVSLQDVPIVGVSNSPVEKPGFLQTKNIFYISISVLLMIGITLILIGLFSKKTINPNENN